MYIITAVYKGRRIRRVAFSDFQAFTIIGRLATEGCTDFTMEKREESERWQSNS